jgi:hypothetical protein
LPPLFKSQADSGPPAESVLNKSGERTLALAFRKTSHITRVIAQGCPPISFELSNHLYLHLL